MPESMPTCPFCNNETVENKDGCNFTCQEWSCPLYNQLISAECWAEQKGVEAAVELAKDNEITELNAKIKSIRKTAFEMISTQTDKIAELRSGYVASQACNEKQRVRIVELEKNV